MLSRQAQQLKDEFARNDAVCAQVMTLFQLIANKVRFRILCVLSRGEFCVREIVEIVGGKISNISQQLKILTLAGVTARRRDGQQILYRLADDRVRAVIQFLQQQFLKDQQAGTRTKTST